MWSWTFNWGEITPRIVVGSCPMKPANLAQIKAATDVTAILSLQHDDCLAYWNIDYTEMVAQSKTLGLQLVRSPMRDFDVADQRRKLPLAVAALAHLQAQGHHTYVHCTAGLGRAPLTVLGYLSWVEGWSQEEAIRMIHSGRPGAVPAWEAYRGCQEDMVKRYQQRIVQKAHELYQARTGIEGDAETDWLQAERAVLRSAFMEFDPVTRGNL